MAGSRTDPLDTVVVIGGSIAGLLAAAATAPHARQVVVIDRDHLPEAAGPRTGTPQAAQTHALLASGRESVERLVSGATADLLARGALRWGADSSANVYIGGSLSAKTTGSAPGLALSRFLLEAYLRARVRDLVNVTVRDRTYARSLLSTRPDEVTGVRVRNLADATARDEHLGADLIVDASGRPGRASRWFAELGWPVPTEEKAVIGLRYATTHLRHRRGELGDATAIVSGATPDLPRAASAIRQEDGTWSVTLAGYAEVAPPLDSDGFRAFAHTLAAPEIAALLDSREFLHEPLPYRFPHCIRRRIEAVRLPQRYAVLGDAISSFDPAWGQGMSVAALQAVALEDVLSQVSALADLPRALARYHLAAVNYVDRAWTLVTGEVLQFDGVTGEVSPVRPIAAAYRRRAQQAAATDAHVAGAVYRVFSLLDPPQALLRPKTALRVLRATLQRSSHDS